MPDITGCRWSSQQLANFKIQSTNYPRLNCNQFTDGKSVHCISLSIGRQSKCIMKLLFIGIVFN